MPIVSRELALPAGPRPTPNTSGIAPRWEWRIFQRRVPLRELARFIKPTEPIRSVETYLLSSESAHNVKIRNDVLEVKRLDRITPAGLERWRPVLRVPFPLSADALATACDALGVPTPRVLGRELARDAFFDLVVTPDTRLRAVETEKVRTRLSFGECPGEGVSLRIEGDPWESLAFEHRDAAVVLDTLRLLHLEVRLNTSYPSGLKRILGWPPGPDSLTLDVNIVEARRAPAF
ncbi:MAG: hypothetical protein HOP28_02130 [Gemmatimonadales bacterium]|nr:hypothetical protein [Gemmatimonadales bacterium]